MTRIYKSSALTAALILTVGAASLWPSTSSAQGTGSNSGGGTAAGSGTGSSSSGTTAGGTNAGTGSMSTGTGAGQSTGAATTTGNSSMGGSQTSSSVVGSSQSNQTTGELQSPASTQTGQSTGTLSTGAAGLQGGGIPSAATQNTSIFNLSNAIQSTFESSSDLQIAQTNLDKDRALVAESADRNNPQISAGGSYTHLDSPIGLAFGGTPIIVEPENTQAFNATGVLPLDISGQVKAATQAAQLQVMADRFNVDRVRNALILNTETSYFDVLRAQHQVQVAQSALTDAQTQLKTAQTQYAGGIGQKIDVFRASTQVSQAEQSLLQAQNAYALSQNNFNDVVGRQLNASVQAQDVPGVTAGTTVTENGVPSTVGSPDASVPQFYAPPSTELDQIDLQKDINTALKARPELRSDMVNVTAAGKQIVLARSSDAPTLSLSAAGDYYPVTDFQTPRHSLGVFTATINIPIFDGGLTHDRVRAARDEQKDAQTSYLSDQTTVELQVRQAYLNLYTSSNQIAAANSALQQAIAARQLAQVRYANGVGLYLEVTDAEAALTSAENSQVNAVYDYLIARAQYENAVGIPRSNPTL